jgi:flagellar biosynthesis protein FlhF
VLREFNGTHLPTVLNEVRRVLGDHACVVDVNCENGRVEVLASEAAVTVHPFQRPDHGVPLVRTARDAADPLGFGSPVATQSPEPAPARQASPPPIAEIRRPPATIIGRDALRTPHPIRPPIVALVGPTGAGKTTTLAKLATHRRAYGAKRVGFIGLDTYRVGAVEQLETYAELAGIPCEIAYELADLDRALARLVECDVILVDTPGRGPRQSQDLAMVRDCLWRLAPDEVHLALPASMMPQVMRRTMAQFASFGVTHMLCTKLDECPVDARVFDVVAREGHTMRWYTDGQEVPADLQSAADKMDMAVSQLAARRRAAEVFA